MVGGKDKKKKSSPFLRQSHDITPSLERCFHASSLPIVIIVGSIFTIIPPVIGVVPSVKMGRGAPACLSGQSMTVSEWDYAL